SAAESLDTIRGRVSVDGQVGADRLTVNDQGAIRGVGYTITSTAVSRFGAASVAYAGVEDLTVNAASVFEFFRPVNQFAVKSTSIATTLNGARSFRDVCTVGNNCNSLDDIRRALPVNGQDGNDWLVLKVQ